MFGRPVAVTMRSKERERLRGSTGAAAAGGEHVAGLLPVGDVFGHTRGGALLGLPVACGEQRGAAEGYKRKRTHSAADLTGPRTRRPSTRTRLARTKMRPPLKSTSSQRRAAISPRRSP